MSSKIRFSASQHPFSRWMRCSVGAVLLLAGCSDGNTWAPVDSTDTQAYVVGAAAEALDENGRFRLPNDVRYPEGELDQSAAGRIAVDYVNAFGRFHVDRWVEEHGSGIDLDGLRVCDRPFYVRSAYRIPLDAPDEIQNSLGPRWIVSLCGPGNRASVTLSFSSRVTALGTADQSAFLTLAPTAHFFSVGIPEFINGPIPAIPEVAVERGARFSGRLISEVPTLVRPAHPQSDLLSRWTTTVNQEVRVRLSSDEPLISTRDLLVGFGVDFRDSGVFVRTGSQTQSALSIQDSAGREWVLQLVDHRSVQAVTIAEVNP